MSDATLSDPHVRAEQNRWYLYCDIQCNSVVRAVIEEVCDEVFSGDGGPTRQRRRVYLDARDIVGNPTPPAEACAAAHDGLDGLIENEMTDDEFRQLINNGTVIPLKGT